MRKKDELTTRQKKALETRKTLFETAIRLFIENGFENVHIEDITREAGTSTGAFYTHFKSKDDVVVEHYKKIEDTYVQAYEKLDPYSSATEKLLNVLKAGFDYSEGLGRNFLGVFFSNQFAQKEDIPYAMHKDRKVYKIVLNIVEEGQQKKEFRTDLDKKDIISMIFKCYTGSHFEWTLMKDERSLAEEGIKFLRLFIEGTVLAKQIPEKT
ncbi:TetR/AcrR family transcriptional regulator [Alkalihalobacterium alkalinitrilicum]|uniref:TetR/AcrR family transcriptional regulator n=1 Tax=Alkalihalobacterium alkalinitrilicum TaxID=427920 RepID=UPI000994AD08|nr:TetR/AcrR family transcriptional regulator [Alkalihalobacterium alkalinitrilicum]